MGGDDLWTYSAIILFFVVLAKIVSQKTSTVDALWLILFGSVGVNLGILPEHKEILEAIGEWGIVFVMFALGFDEDLNLTVPMVIKWWEAYYMGRKELKILGV